METSDGAEDQRFEAFVYELVDLVHRHFGGTVPASNAKDVASLLLAMCSVIAGTMIMCELKVGKGAATAVRDRFIKQLDRSYADAVAFYKSTSLPYDARLLKQLLEVMKTEGNG